MQPALLGPAAVAKSHHRSSHMLSLSGIVVILVVSTMAIGQASCLTQTMTTGVLLCAIGDDTRGEFPTDRILCQLRDGIADIEELLAAACEQLKSTTNPSTRHFTYAFGDDFKNRRKQISQHKENDILQTRVRK